MEVGEVVTGSLSQDWRSLRIRIVGRETDSCELELDTRWVGYEMMKFMARNDHDQRQRKRGGAWCLANDFLCTIA